MFLSLLRLKNIFCNFIFISYYNFILFQQNNCFTNSAYFSLPLTNEKVKFWKISNFLFFPSKVCCSNFLFFITPYLSPPRGDCLTHKGKCHVFANFPGWDLRVNFSPGRHRNSPVWYDMVNWKIYFTNLKIYLTDWPKNTEMGQ